jgi:hypothetical protein
MMVSHSKVTVTDGDLDGPAALVFKEYKSITMK